MKILEITTLIGYIVSMCVTLFPVITWIFKIVKASRCQLRTEMLRIYYHNKDLQKIRQYEYENFIFLYNAYKALKGNSFIDKIYSEVKLWEIIT